MARVRPGRPAPALPGRSGAAAFDNIAWLTDDTVAVVEDRGDTFYSEGNGIEPTALDSGWAIDADAGHGTQGAPAPVRFFAEGRDASAAIDSALLDADTPGFTSDGDNEITGVQVSDGDPTVAGILGAKDPRSPRSPTVHFAGESNAMLSETRRDEDLPLPRDASGRRGPRSPGAPPGRVAIGPRRGGAVHPAADQPRLTRALARPHRRPGARHSGVAPPRLPDGARGVIAR